MSDLLPVYIGYDTREHAAYLTCRETVLRPDSEWYDPPAPKAIPIPLVTRDLRRQGLFTRPWQIDETGQAWDVRDGRPFSTEFSHSRFLVPHIAAAGRPRGKRGWAMFVDCDFFFRTPVWEIMQHADNTKAIMVVKHPWYDIASGVKMDGQVQAPYRRKLWSSLILWNLDHPANSRMIDDANLANVMEGSWLHSFGWLAEDEIGELPSSWNWIPGLTAPLGGAAEPDAVHWSYGGPWLQGYENVPFADNWRECYEEIVQLRAPAAAGAPSILFPFL